MNNEYELIENPHIKYLKIFLVRMTYRQPHIHSCFEICLVLDGNVQVNTRKESFVYKEKSFFLLNPGQPHELLAMEESALILSIQITPKFCQNYYPSIRNLEFLVSNISVAVSDVQSILFYKQLLSLAQDYFFRHDTYELTCMGKINLLIATLISSLPHIFLNEEEMKDATNRNNRLSRIVEYIESHYTEKLLLSDIAEQEHLSLCYLSHFFKDNFNITFQDYLNNIRFEKAQQLLLKTDMNMLNIYMDCGFSDGRYLNKMFLERYGCTAKEYRKRALNSTDTSSSLKNNQAQKFYSDDESLSVVQNFLQI